MHKKRRNDISLKEGKEPVLFNYIVCIHSVEKGVSSFSYTDGQSLPVPRGLVYVVEDGMQCADILILFSELNCIQSLITFALSSDVFRFFTFIKFIV